MRTGQLFSYVDSEILFVMIIYCGQSGRSSTTALLLEQDFAALYPRSGGR
ncbi:hypothetical protein [Rhizobium sp. M1]|nr:hypothetical protein [Rhizobium sp. M1]